MNKQLNLGSLQIPIAAATKTFAILAKRGAGKSYTAAVLAEEFYAAGVPFVALDPIDVWWGLRLDKDGKSPGLPVVVFGLEHADVPLTQDMGQEIARAIVHENVSCVLSTFGMSKTGQRKLIADFAEELLLINNTPRHVFVEEAHQFVPQRIIGDMARSFAAVESLVVMGRNRGLGATLINQRAATINKDILTQVDTLLAFRNVAPQDRKALREWVEYHAAEGDFVAFMESLPSLPTGEGWIWSPEFLGIFERITIRQRRTLHPDREKMGNSFTMPQAVRPDIQEFIRQFQKVLPAAVGNNPLAEVRRLQSVIADRDNLIAKQKTEIQQLKRQVEQLSKSATMVAPTTALSAGVPKSAATMQRIEEQRPPAQRSKAAEERQQRQWNAFISDLRRLEGHKRDILVYLMEREGRYFSMSELARALVFKESTILNHPPLDVIRLGLIRRTGKGRNSHYSACAQTKLADLFPGWDADEMVGKIVRAIKR